MELKELVTHPIFVSAASILLTISFKKYIEPALPEGKVLGKFFGKFILKVFEFGIIYLFPFLLLFNNNWDTVEGFDKQTVMGMILGVSSLLVIIVGHIGYYLNLKLEKRVAVLERKVKIIAGEDVDTLRKQVIKQVEDLNVKPNSND